MKAIIVLLLIGAGFFFGPQLMEKTNSPCSALELRVVSAISSQTSSPGDRAGSLIIGGLLAQASNGAFAGAAAQQRYPNLPPQLACATQYWQVLIQSNQSATAATPPR